MKEENVLAKLERAIRANVSPPKPEELLKYEFAKKLPASPSLEGNFEIGLILFIGIAAGFTVGTKEAVEMYLSIDSSECAFKLNDYNERLEKSKRFRTKIKLILNYMKNEKS